MNKRTLLGIVVPMRNEAAHLPKLLASLKHQSGIDSVCCLAIVDGCSEDDSKDVARSWQPALPMLHVFDNPKKNTPTGFNREIRACMEAGANAILLIGTHSWPEADFLQRLQQILAGTDAELIGAVHNYPEPTSWFEKVVQAFSESRLGRRLRFYSKLKLATPTNVAFTPTIRRQVFERIGVFDENMIRNQDNDFTSRPRAAGFRIITDPRLRYTYVPRRSLSLQLRQLYDNGYWGGRRLNVVGLKQFAPAIFWGGLSLSMVLGLLFGGYWHSIIYA
jgi:succinoglycan biosynthesis protein ExoA